MNLLLSFVLLTPAGLAQYEDSGAISPPIPADSPFGRAIQETAENELYFSSDGARAPREPRGRTERSYALAADHVVHPITAANYSEDGLITTDVRGIYYNQSFPRSEPVGGGSTRVYDFQGRYAVDDRLQLVDQEDPTIVQSRIIGSQIMTELWASLGLFSIFELGLMLPLVGAMRRVKSPIRVLFPAPFGPISPSRPPSPNLTLGILTTSWAW